MLEDVYATIIRKPFFQGMLHKQEVFNKDRNKIVVIIDEAHSWEVTYRNAQKKMCVRAHFSVHFFTISLIDEVKILC